MSLYRVTILVEDDKGNIYNSAVLGEFGSLYSAKSCYSDTRIKLDFSQKKSSIETVRKDERKRS